MKDGSLVMLSGGAVVGDVGGSTGVNLNTVYSYVINKTTTTFKLSPIANPLTVSLPLSSGDISGNKITSAIHSLNNKDVVNLTVSTGGTLPTGLSAGVDYYVIGMGTNDIQLCTTRDDPTVVVITGGGTGTLTIKAHRAITAGGSGTLTVNETPPEWLDVVPSVTQGAKFSDIVFPHSGVLHNIVSDTETVHTLEEGEQYRFAASGSSAVLPTGLVAETNYFISDHPTTTATGTLASGNQTISSLSSVDGINVGYSVTGDGIQANTIVTNIVGSSINVSPNPTTTGPETLTFTKFNTTKYFRLSYKRGGPSVNFADSGEVNISYSPATVYSFIFKRYANKNRIWVYKADYTRIIPNLDITYLSGGLYTTATTAEENVVKIDSVTEEHLPVLRSTRDIIFMGDYFYVDFDRAVVTGGITLGERLFRIHKGSIGVTGGIPYQYRYSYLRDISESGEVGTDGTSMEFLIEGPPSEETEEIPSQIGASNENFLRVKIPNVPSDVKKVRLYRVGGDYARYGVIGDLSITAPIFDDTSRTLGATTLAPLIDRNPPSESLTDITNVSGIFFGADD